MSEPMPRIMAAPRPAREAAIHRGAHRPRSCSDSPPKIASPIRKWPMLSSTISGSAAIGLGGVDSRGRGRHGPRGRAPSRALAPALIRSNSIARHRGVPVDHAPRTTRRCGSRSPARRPRPRSRSASRRRAMNSDTRMPAAVQLGDDRRELIVLAARRRARPRWSAPARRSGTMQAACGRALQRDVDHLARRRHLEIQRLGRARAFSRAMSSSRMWRRSSRRCAVMPSAPASTASLARPSPDRDAGRRARCGWSRRDRC